MPSLAVCLHGCAPRLRATEVVGGEVGDRGPSSGTDGGMGASGQDWAQPDCRIRFASSGVRPLAYMAWSRRAEGVVAMRRVPGILFTTAIGRSKP